MRTPFAYTPSPTRRTDLAYRLGRDYFRLPIYGLAAFAACGVGAMLIGRILGLWGAAR